MNFVKSQNQCLNTLLLPGGLAPSSYDSSTFSGSYNLRLLFIPFRSSLCASLNYLYSSPTHIPVLLCINSHPSTTLLCIHFHGNACDIGQIAICAQRESQAFKAHYLMVEYPGFGLSEGYGNELVVNEVARTVYEFVTNELCVHFAQVVLIGRSIGTGPACWLASLCEGIGKPPLALILQSPFSSIQDAVSDLLGPYISAFLLNRWMNWQYLVGTDKNVVKCPVLFIHADNDRIINCQHSQLMHQFRIKYGLPSEIFMQQSSENNIKGHNYFNYEYDVVVPSRDFLLRVLKGKYGVAQRSDVIAVPDNLKNKSIHLPVDIITNLQSLPRDLAANRFDPAASSRNKICRQCPSKCDNCMIFSAVVCPCTFCCEAMLACNLSIAFKCLRFCRVISPPPFEYTVIRRQDPTIKSGLWGLIFRRKSFERLTSEEEAAIRNKSSPVEVINPINSTKQQKEQRNIEEDDVNNRSTNNAFIPG